MENATNSHGLDRKFYKIFRSFFETRVKRKNKMWWYLGGLAVILIGLVVVYYHFREVGAGLIPVAHHEGQTYFLFHKTFEGAKVSG